MRLYLHEQISMLNNMYEKDPEKLLKLVLLQESNSLLEMSKKDLKELKIRNTQKFLEQREMAWREAFESENVVELLMPVIKDKMKNMNQRINHFILEESLN